VVGGYALHRMRRRLQWHLIAAAFYAPQTFALTSPLHVDMWTGLFAAAPFHSTAEVAIAVNQIALALALTHACLGLLDSRFGAHLHRLPAVMLSLTRSFWGSEPLSRAALARRFASIATVATLVFLPLVPADAFYSNGQALEFVQTQYFSAWFERDDIIFWRRLLLLPIAFVAAYAVAFVWSGRSERARAVVRDVRN
jgi:hypothetical protein